MACSGTALATQLQKTEQNVRKFQCTKWKDTPGELTHFTDAFFAILHNSVGLGVDLLQMKIIVAKLVIMHAMQRRVGKYSSSCLVKCSARGRTFHMKFSHFN
jgi:hypothetical protein